MRWLRDMAAAGEQALYYEALARAREQDAALRKMHLGKRA